MKDLHSGRPARRVRNEGCPWVCGQGTAGLVLLLLAGLRPGPAPVPAPLPARVPRPPSTKMAPPAPSPHARAAAT